MAHVLLDSTESYRVILFSFIFGQTFLQIFLWNWCSLLPVGAICAGGGAADAVVIKRSA